MNRVHAVGVIFEDADGNILVLKRHKKDPEGETWGLVGGKIDDGEDKFQAAVREVSEEIGLNINSTDLQFVKTFHWNRDDMDLKFEVFRLPITQDKLKINLEKQENTKYRWSSPTGLYKQKDLMVGLYPILEEIYKVSKQQFV